MTFCATNLDTQFTPQVCLYQGSYYIPGSKTNSHNILIKKFDFQSLKGPPPYIDPEDPLAMTPPAAEQSSIMYHFLTPFSDARISRA